MDLEHVKVLYCSEGGQILLYVTVWDMDLEHVKVLYCSEGGQILLYVTVRECITAYLVWESLS